jgi:hypothetical protein
VLLLPALAEALSRNQKRGQILTDDEVRLLYSWQQHLHEYDQRVDNSKQPVEDVVTQLLSAMGKKHPP